MEGLSPLLLKHRLDKHADPAAQRTSLQDSYEDFLIMAFTERYAADMFKRWPRRKPYHLSATLLLRRLDHNKAEHFNGCPVP